MAEEIKFISIKAIKNAFIQGIDSFLELYNIQNNKNIVSNSLGNKAQNITRIGTTKVHTNEITTVEVEKANRIKAMINRESTDEGLKKLFIAFGKQLQQIASDKNNKRLFITTHYSFIALTILHQSTVIDLSKDNHEINFSDIFFDIKELTTYYLTPDTRHKKIMIKLFDNLGKALEKLDNNVLTAKYEWMDSLELENTSDTDKLWAFLCDNENFKSEAEKFLGKDKFKNYSNLAEKINKANHYNDIDPYDQSKISEKIAEKLQKCFIKANKTLSISKAISDALVSYNLKFEQNTSNPAAGRVVANYLGDETQDFATGVARTQLILSITDKMANMNDLQIAFPPALIGVLVMNISNTLIKICFESKGYGVVNRHGITGQIRTCLLKNYINLTSTFIRNNYLFLFTNKVGKVMINNFFERNSYFLDNFCTDFINSYKSATEVLPNKNKQGSLYFYLSMYANPKDDDCKPDIYKMREWSKNKVSWVNDGTYRAVPLKTSGNNFD